jgi:ABC-type glycerol-3-phosphate transport system substrate-binding protein
MVFIVGPWAALMQRKSLFLASLLAFLGALPLGCRRVAPPPPPPPHQGVNVRVACPAGLPAALVRSHARAWSARQQATVEVRPYTASPEEVPGADVWVLPPPELPRWAAADRLAPLPDSLAKPGTPYEWMGLLPLYREQLLVWDRVAFGLPLSGEAPVCCYRADLFADAARRTAYRAFLAKRGAERELRAPTTWEEFADVAEFFRANPSSGAGPVPSLPPLPADDVALDRLFYTVASSFARRAVREEEPAGAGHLDEVFSFHYDLRTGAPRIATPGFVAALQLLQRLHACRPDGVSREPAEAFRTGKAVLCLTDAAALVGFQKEPGLRDRFGIARVPGAGRYYTFSGEEQVLEGRSNYVPYLGGAGWLAVVPRGAARAEAAFDLLADLSGPQTGAQVALEPRWGGGPTRLDQLGRDRWDAFDLDSRRTTELREALAKTLQQHGLKNPVLCLRTPDQAPHRAALVAELRAALAGKVEPRQALERAAARWAELDGKRGAERHKAEYRISLGLLGR